MAKKMFKFQSVEAKSELVNVRILIEKPDAEEKMFIQTFLRAHNNVKIAAVSGVINNDRVEFSGHFQTSEAENIRGWLKENGATEV